MLIHGPRYFQVLKRALAEADRASLAIAFWGAGAERLFAGWQGRTLRIICNLSLGGTNPAGGRGNVLGAALAVISLGVLSSGFQVIGSRTT